MKNTTVLFLLLFFASSTSFAQGKFVFNLTATTGVSKIQPNIPFHLTPLYNVYQFVRISHNEPYSFGQFAKDYQLIEEYNQFRFGVNFEVTHTKIPVFAMGEISSSPSTYEKFAYGVTAGIGKDFINTNNFVFSPRLGYKVVQDNGYGSRTLVNSIGLKEARELAATFFDPANPIGSQRGNLLTAKLGIGKQFKAFHAGLSGYYELDLTDKIKRQARMTNYGLNAYATFNLNN